jgi:AcrR family transcriptional regulator
MYRKLPRGRRGANGLSKEDVAADQRRRLRGAMVEAVAAHGYAETTTRELSRLAAVSKQDMYRRFPNKETYFLETYDEIIQHAWQRVGAAYRSEGDWQAGLRAAFDAYAAEVVARPKAARLALVGVLGAGPVALERMRLSRRKFEEMIAQSFAAAPDRVAVPAIVVKGIVCGIERITRRRLADGVEQLPGLGEELLAWTLSYRCAAAARLGDPSLAPRWGSVPLRESPTVEKSASEQVRILRATAQLVARAGYSQLTVGQIIDAAEVSEEAFIARYSDVEQCFLAALSLLAVEALCSAERASSPGGADPLAGVRSGIVTLLRHITSDPVLMRVAFVEVLAVGLPAVECREALLCKFDRLLTNRLPEPLRPPGVTVEAIVGAIWGVLDHYVAQGSTQLLPALMGHALYLALAPVIGGEAAVEAILAELPVVRNG